MDYADHCPPSITELIRTANLETSESMPLFSQIETVASLDCQVAAVGAIADRLTPFSHPQAMDDFFGAVGRYAAILQQDEIAAVRDAYLRLPFQSSLAVNYFWGLRSTGIDIRGRLKGRVPEDWTFTHPLVNAATWHYNLYLASLGDDVALQALSDKIAATKDGNDATNLLRSFSELRQPGVDEILRSYAHDTRTADGPVGPGSPISESIQLFLMMRKTP